MNDVNKLYSLWLEKAVGDLDLQSDLAALEGNAEEINERFYRDLEFGTAGLRGIIGAGTNRMNIYTVGRATQGLADYLLSNYDNPAVAIAYDSRIKSDTFAKHAASVLAANGIKVYFYSELVPTPMLSFAVRELGCKGGIIITASHNPSEYNGYKCYDPEGYQMTDEAAEKTYEYIMKTDIFDGVKTVDFDAALAEGVIEYIPQSVYDEFYRRVEQCCLSLDICKSSGLKVIYTPLNGTGNKPVRYMLAKIGIEDVQVVPEQEMPDGSFPTCPYPNPEKREVFALALEMAKKNGADLLLATDPDCDRVGIAVKVGEDYELMTGNEVGVLLTEYLLSRRLELGTLPENPVIVKSFVTTNLVDKVAEKYGATAENLLTGFKYIGELVTKLEAEGQADRFIAGMEESYGYLSGIHARDKDAVVASVLICEMAAYYKSKGKSLYEVMQDIYAEHGLYLNVVDSFEFPGASGMEKMAKIMEGLREISPKTLDDECSFGGYKVVEFTDLRSREGVSFVKGEKTVSLLPSSNVLYYKLESNNAIIVRPSGTEPKIKVYYTACAADREGAAAIKAKLSESMKEYLA